MKLKTRQITVTAILLAICIVSQFFKNLNVYITGPIINAALILTTVYAGLACGKHLRNHIFTDINFHNRQI